MWFVGSAVVMLLYVIFSSGCCVNSAVTVVAAVVVVVVVVMVLVAVVSMLPGVVEFSDSVPSRHCKSSTDTSKKNCPPNNT